MVCVSVGKEVVCEVLVLLVSSVAGLLSLVVVTCSSFVVSTSGSSFA